MDVGSGSNSGTNKSRVDRTPGGAGHRKEYGRNNPAGGGFWPPRSAQEAGPPVAEG